MLATRRESGRKIENPEKPISFSEAQENFSESEILKLEVAHLWTQYTKAQTALDKVEGVEKNNGDEKEVMENARAEFLRFFKSIGKKKIMNIYAWLPDITTKTIEEMLRAEEEKKRKSKENENRRKEEEKERQKQERLKRKRKEEKSIAAEQEFKEQFRPSSKDGMFKLKRAISRQISACRIAGNVLDRAIKSKSSEKKIKILVGDEQRELRQYYALTKSLSPEQVQDVEKYLKSEHAISSPLRSILTEDMKNREEFENTRDSRDELKNYLNPFKQNVGYEFENDTAQIPPRVAAELPEATITEICPHGNTGFCWDCSEETSEKYGLPPNVAHFKSLKRARLKRESTISNQSTPKGANPDVS